jgi:hypothetical protein
MSVDDVSYYINIAPTSCIQFSLSAELELTGHDSGFLTQFRNFSAPVMKALRRDFVKWSCARRPSNAIAHCHSENSLTNVHYATI